MGNTILKENSNESKVEFKGNRNGIIISIYGMMNTDEIIEGISEKIDAALPFFKGAKLYKIESELLAEDELDYIKGCIVSKYDEVFSEALSEDKNIEKKVKAFYKEKIASDANNGKAEYEESCNEEKEVSGIHKEAYEINKLSYSEFDTKYVDGMRSGSYVEFDGDVIVRSDLKSGSKVVSGRDILVMGNIYPGAQAVADGNVVVMGKLLGFVHAGAKGNGNAYIVAKTLTPTILKIAEVIAEAPEDSQICDNENATAEIAFISDDRIIIEVQ